MKSFTNFFTEARVSQASQQAERRGLTGDGHGNWMDKEGNIVAKTEQGRLVLLDKKVKAPQQEAPKKVRKAKEEDIKDSFRIRIIDYIICMTWEHLLHYIILSICI